ncbi:SKU5 similar 13 [Zea mays]|uniref:SKU5 similar 13 n=1 Tax=Zea mays TaxID=4577 RepID=A0A1D6N8K4_MAIZE|nr:SKU5 similar 13 [Zea mays]
MGPGKWTPASRSTYNLLDTVSRHTIQVYPRSWTAVMMTFDNAGMWSIRSNIWERQYLGEQLYVSVISPEHARISLGFPFLPSRAHGAVYTI